MPNFKKFFIDHVKKNYHKFYFFSVLIIATAVSFGLLLTAISSTSSAQVNPPRVGNLKYYGYWTYYYPEIINYFDEFKYFTNIVHTRIDTMGTPTDASSLGFSSAVADKVKSAGMKMTVQIPFQAKESWLTNPAERMSILQKSRQLLADAGVLSSTAYIEIGEEWYTMMGSYDSWTILQGKSTNDKFITIKSYLEAAVADAKTVFSGIPIGVPEISVSPHRFPVTPPNNVDVIMLDAYFPLTNGNCDSTQRAIFDSYVTGAYNAALGYGKPVVMIGQAFTWESSPMPSPCQMQWFYDLAKNTSYRIEAFIWFIYADGPWGQGARSYSDRVSYQKTIGCEILGIPASSCVALTSPSPTPTPPPTTPTPTPPSGSTVSGYVYEDLNTSTCCDGTRDSGEPTLAGRTVILGTSNCAGGESWTTLATTTTNGSGFYSFNINTSYTCNRVTFSTPAGFTKTTDDSKYFATDIGNYAYDFGIYRIPPSPTPPLPTPTPTPLPTPGFVVGPASAPESCDPNDIATGISKICDFQPSVVLPGYTVEISGVALTENIEITPSTGGTPINITGIVGNNGQIVSFIAPSNIEFGDYLITNNGLTGIATASKTLTILDPTQWGPASGTFAPASTWALPSATNFNDLISNAYNYAIIFVGIAVFVMIMWGGFLWLTSAANPGNIATAKRYITNALLGAVILLASYVILRTINPELVGGGTGFVIPGIKPPSVATTSATAARLIATTELEAASAIINGCTVATELRNLTAVECPSDTTEEIGLPIDPIVSTSDTNTNQQIGATVLHTSGNLGAGRTVVVLDTGYNYNHPELSSSYLGGWDFANNDNDPMDDQGGGTGSPGHGSHVAGIITADGVAARAKGVAPQAQIIAGKILDGQGRGFWSNMIKGIYWAVNGPDGTLGTADDFKPDVINISIGGKTYSSICDSADEQLARAIKYARDNGVLVVAAAGNLSGGVTLPGCIDSAFTVSAVNSSDKIAGFSGRGPAVDISAPGVGIYSSLLDNSYGTKQGTSMAAPVVSGIAALLKAANPSMTVDELEQRIISTSCDLGSTGKDALYGWGRITANPGNCSPPPPTPTPPPSRPRGSIRVSPVSCTKTISSGNPNCDITVNYSASNLTPPASIDILRNNVVIQTVNCSSPSCNGQIADANPPSGTHKYSMVLTGGASLDSATAYVYATGTITAGFGSCVKFANTSNPNCDVSLDITAPGIYPGSVVITKDGTNWRLVQCPNQQCATTIIDANPAVGTHTYTLRDSSGSASSRIQRTTVVISLGTSQCDAQPADSNATIELCTGANFTGTCQTLNCAGLNNFNSTAIRGQPIQSTRITGVNRAKVYTCDTGWVHPNPSTTEPTPCLWKYVYQGAGVPNIWAPANDWCYWTWIGGTSTVICNQPTPAVPGIRINSYGGLYPGSW